ncbi:hypothetical protein DOTSEDRAFT_48335 [Dothistroma septosporum NZE10]|uniref:BZIP domain-containing protein n=1 Tax=Dothistroma septosporum (strain NZE10 / CBS 128990) TaxID=675120 RepID=M2Y0L4_DOTSN|nr:hypothetical protein DOTSEDRAFT_48335 [Dothistroma septosporum NZE10]
MNHQRPLIAEGDASARSANSHGDMDVRPSMPMPAMPQRKKKPGPKRDSKPAPNEKLERNRQAQRTHRERKEQYTKDLELEVMRLKELYVKSAQERDAALKTRDEATDEQDRLRVENRRLREENQRMREALQGPKSSTDSSYDALSVSCDATRNSSFSTTDGFPGMVAPVNLQELAAQNSLAESRRPNETPIKIERAPSREGSTHISAQLIMQLPAISIDYDELGLDFVLSLEKPCMGHMHYLHIRAHNSQSGSDEAMEPPTEVPDDGENQHISGHALMATAPSYSAVMKDPTTRYPTQYPHGLKREDLMNLLNLASQLETNEVELPPVKAWLRIMQDARLRQLSVNDFDLLKQNLLSKVHCYRFGAVIEDHDIEDALQQVLQWKTGEATSYGTAKAMPPPAHPSQFDSGSMLSQAPRSVPPGTAL